MNYATGNAFNLKDLFMNFNTKKLKISCKDCQKVNNNPHKDVLAMQIFKACYQLVLNDIIDNNITFHLPTGSRPSYIHIKRVKGDDFSKARRNGKWEDVDFLKSFFSGYELELVLLGKNKPPRTKPIYVDKKLKNKITESTNNGKVYY